MYKKAQKRIEHKERQLPTDHKKMVPYCYSTMFNYHYLLKFVKIVFKTYKSNNKS